MTTPTQQTPTADKAPITSAAASSAAAVPPANGNEKAPEYIKTAAAPTTFVDDKTTHLAPSDTKVAPNVDGEGSTSTNAGDALAGTTAAAPNGASGAAAKGSELSKTPSPVKSASAAEHAVGTFAGGAAVTNSKSDPAQGLSERAATAHSALTPEAQSKILKSETKNSKQMSKILKNEAKAQDSLLKNSIKELARLQSVQKSAASAESKALTTHTKTTRTEQTTASAYQKAKAAFERATAELKSATEALETTREHSKAQSEALRVKSLEVEQATKQKAADDREREVKLAELKALRANAPKGGFLCF